MKDLKKNSKSKKAGIVRATFSLPGSALVEIDALRRKLALDGYILNKSEVIRVGLAALECLPNKNVRKAIGEIERFKAGRPNTNG